MSEKTFTNQNVGENSIPEADDLSFEELAENYTRTLRIEGFTILLILIFINVTITSLAGVLPRVLSFWWIHLIYLVPSIFIFWFAPIYARSKGFALREKDIHYKSGVIWKKTTSLPFNRIQHVELESGPIERLFKLTTLKLYSAGGSKADMAIPALPFSRSKKLREYIIQKTNIIDNGETSVQ